MSEEKNIVIAGGGLVGLLAAILLAQNSISIHVLEKKKGNKLSAQSTNLDYLAIFLNHINPELITQSFFVAYLSWLFLALPS